MTRIAPTVLMCVGLVLAGLYGARNGDAYAEYRARKEMGESPQLPSPRARLDDWFAVGGLGWGLGLGLIVVGAGLARRQQASDAAGTGGTGIQVDFAVEVQRALDEVAAIQTLIADLPMDRDHEGARHRIDRLAFNVFGPIVDARGSFVARHGMATFAEYFGPYSAGERQLARCWSAITDGHSVVARESAAAAHQSLSQALAIWRAKESA